MRLDAFHAKGVYGYLNFDLKFHSSHTILVGPNGSGKTTALRLMQGLLTPSVRDLLSIDFLEASLSYSDTSSSKVINARKAKDSLILSHSGVDGRLNIPTSLLDSLEPDIGDHRRAYEFSRLMRVKYSDNPTFRAISELHAPVFLGLDRRNIGFQDDLAAGVEASLASRDAHRRSSRAIRGSLAAGLMETEALIRDAYRRVRQLKDQQSERLRKKLLLTGFRYTDISKTNFDQLTSETRQLSQGDLARQRTELIRALEGVGIDNADARRELDPFFERVMALSKRLRAQGEKPSEKDHGEAFFEALLNQSNLVRLRDLVEAVREFNSKSDQLLSRFQGFVTCINRFFSDSRKQIEIDPVGAVKIHRPDGTDVPIEALSSGERQLLIMFGHVFFNSFGDRSNVFVIDEPELSLHLRWQEMLLQEMVDSSPRAQFVVATHSPEIVGELTESCVQV